MEILFLIVVLALIWLATRLFPSFYDKGAEGERLIWNRLMYFEKEGRGKLLSNIYIPKASGGTTEIDILLIHPKGLFVFESKNYSGWIFGNERYQYWTQTLPKGWYGDVHKERFYNPILQNASHIKHLSPFIGKSIPIWSIVVFSDQCELKEITIRSKNVRVTQCYNVAHVVEKLCYETQMDFLTEVEISDLYERLRIYTNVSEEKKQLHAQGAFEAKQRF